MDNLIEEIEALYQKATKGPWHHDEENNDEDRLNKFGQFELHSLQNGTDVGGTKNEQDAIFIVKLVNAWPLIKKHLGASERAKKALRDSHWGKGWEIGMCGEEGRMHNESVTEILTAWESEEKGE